MREPPDSPRPRRRSVRRNPHQTVTRWNNADYARLLENAERAGLKVGAYIRKCALNAPTTRAHRRPSVDEVKLAPLLKAVNKMGGNLHIIARHLNFGGFPEAGEIHAALDGYYIMVVAVVEAMGRRL